MRVAHDGTVRRFVRIVVEAHAFGTKGLDEGFFRVHDAVLERSVLVTLSAADDHWLPESPLKLVTGFEVPDESQRNPLLAFPIIPGMRHVSLGEALDVLRAARKLPTIRQVDDREDAGCLLLRPTFALGHVLAPRCALHPILIPSHRDPRPLPDPLLDLGQLPGDAARAHLHRKRERARVVELDDPRTGGW